LEAYELAIQKDPSLVFSVFMQNSDLRIEASHTAIDRMLFEPDNIFANELEEYSWLGKYYLFNSDLANAEDSFRHILEEDGTNENALFGLAKTFQFSGQMDQAEEYINTALFLAPHTFEGNILNGQISRAKGQEELAAQSFDTAFDILFARTYSLDYYYNIYNEYAPHTDLVPEYIYGGLLTETVEDLYWLADFHTRHGSMERANLITKYLDGVASR
jgi:tetratricopeptide (TPR) repeat protein